MRWPIILVVIYLCSSCRSQSNNLRTHKDAAFKKALRIVQEKLHAETVTAQRLLNIVDSASFRYVSSFMDAKPYVKYLSLSGMGVIEATKILANEYKVFGDNLWNLLKPMHFRLDPLPGVFGRDNSMPEPLDISHCPYPRHFVCEESYLYRSYDGSCNSLPDGIAGRSLLPLRRMLPSQYGDGIESVRMSTTGGYLPSPRAASLSMFPDVNRPNGLHTLLAMTFGQFIDHDLTRTAISKAAVRDGAYSKEMMVDIKCGFDGCTTDEPGLETCWPIPVPKDDYDFRFNTCLKFVRSQEVPGLDCEFGPREQVNQLTSWLDASMIYGSTKEEADFLRDYNNKRGRLAMSHHPHGKKPLLPHGEDELCRDTNATIQCFAAGDGRVNEQVSLTALHVMYLREHNRIEAILYELNPHWGGEKLYQETRKIVWAVWQHIVFNEYLPILLGPKLLRDYGLNLESDDYYTGYDSRMDPRPTNEFATAAFRYGHTLIHDSLIRTYHDYTSDENLKLSQGFHRPMQIYDTARGGVDALIRGMCEGPCQTFDPFFTKQITRSLFTERPPHGPGADLLSLNIQRGRDHGLPGYNAYRKICGLRKAVGFGDLKREIPDADARQRLAEVYSSVDDIDLFAGASSEVPVEGAIVGPTFACIIADTFKRLKVGDRFWFENNHVGGFNKEQIREIKKMKLAKIMCHNSDHITTIQPWALYYPTDDKGALRYLNNVVASDFWKDSLAFANNFENEKQGRRQAQASPLLSEAFRMYPHLLPTKAGVPYNIRMPCSEIPDIDFTKWRHGPYTGSDGYAITIYIV